MFKIRDGKTEEMAEFYLTELNGSIYLSVETGSHTSVLLKICNEGYLHITNYADEPSLRKAGLRFGGKGQIILRQE